MVDVVNKGVMDGLAYHYPVSSKVFTKDSTTRTRFFRKPDVTLVVNRTLMRSTVSKVEDE